MKKYRTGEVDNFHLSVRCPQSLRRRLPERTEQKFFVAKPNREV
jgi:hypothetical protein